MPLLETRGSGSALAYGLNSFISTEVRDIYASNTVFLLKNNGVSSATNTTFLDSASSPNTVTKTGNVSYGSFSPFLNETSRYFNGSNTYFSIPDSDTFNFGSGDFTVEFWAKTTTSSDSTAHPVFNQSASGASSDSSIFVGFGTNASVYVSSGTGWTYNATSSGIACNDNEWHHIAAVRTGTSLRIYVDGILRGSTTLAGGFTLGNSTRLVEIGYQTSGSYYVGWASNLRVVKGTAVYTSNFTPPQQKLTAISGTSLLTLIKSRNIDESSNSHRISAFGTHQTSIFYPPVRKENQYSSLTDGGSIYFDGNGDYLTIPHSTAFNFGTGNFTIEYWAKFDTLTPNGTFDFQTTYTKGYTNGILLQTTNGTGRLQVYLANGTPTLTEPSNPEVGTWIHYALVRNGSTVTLYKNGVSVATGTSSANVSSSNAIGIGANINDGSGQANGTYPFKGNLSNYRVSNVARYTSNFTPHSSPLSSDANTLLLLKGENSAIYDITGNNVIETTGSAVNTTYKKFISESSTSFGNSSVRFESPNSQDYNFGDKDFTLDGWVYPVSNNNTSSSNWWPIMALGKGGAGANTYGTLDISSFPKLDIHCTSFNTINPASSNEYNSTKIGTLRADMMKYNTSYASDVGTTHSFYVNVFDVTSTPITGILPGSGSTNTVIELESSFSTSAQANCYANMYFRITDGAGLFLAPILISESNSVAQTITLSQALPFIPASNTYFKKWVE